MKKLITLLLFALLLTACENNNENNDDKVEQTKPHFEYIDVTMTAEASVTDSGTIVIKGSTNLPNEASLKLKISRIENTSTFADIITTAIVENGTFEGTIFGNLKDKIPSGEYKLLVTLSDKSEQSSNFLNTVGENYEALIGLLITNTNSQKELNYITTFEVEQTEDNEDNEDEILENQTEKSVEDTNNSPYISKEEVKDILEFNLIGDNDEITNVDVKNGEIKATIKWGIDEYYSRDNAVVAYQGISDELLNREDWNVLTINFEGIGSISMNRNEAISEGFGYYFPSEKIEQKLR